MHVVTAKDNRPGYFLKSDIIYCEEKMRDCHKHVDI